MIASAEPGAEGRQEPKATCLITGGDDFRQIDCLPILAKPGKISRNDEQLGAESGSLTGSESKAPPFRG